MQLILSQQPEFPGAGDQRGDGGCLISGNEKRRSTGRVLNLRRMLREAGEVEEEHERESGTSIVQTSGLAVML